MSKINKIITNKPITLTQEEVANLSETLSAVRTAGGGGGGATYGGDGRYIEITGNNTITLTTTAANQLDRPIPTKVSDLEDASDYATIESLTAYQVAGDYLSANALNSLSGTWETVTAKLDTTAFSTVSGNFLTAHQSLTDYYTKLQTSGASELNTAFGSKQDNLTQEQLSAISSVSSIKGTILTGDSNIRATSAEAGNNIKWTLELTAQPVVTDTTLSGYDGIVAVKDSTVSSQWNIGIAQAYKEQIEEISSKLTKTDADTYYAPISVTGDVDTLKSSSGNWNKVSAKLDTSAFSSVSGKFISASYPFTADLGGGSKLSVTNGATAVFTNGASFSSFANTLIQGIANTTILGNSFCQGTNNTADGDSLAQGSVNYAKNTSIAQGSVNSAINCSQAFGVGNVITDTGMAIGKYNKTSSDASFVIGNGTNSNRSDLFIIKHDGTVSSTGDFIVDGKSLSSVYNTVSTNSGGWLKESDLNYYVTSSDITTQDTDYVMTTTGWKVLTLPGGGMTQVIHDTTLTGQGNADDSKLGVAWSALSGNTIASALSAGSAASAYFATKAKYGDQREYDIGSEIYGLTYFRTSIVNWTNLINGNSGIDVLDLDEDGYPETFQLTQTAYNAVTSVSSKLDTTAFSNVSGTFLTKSSADNDYAPKSVTATVNTLTAASAGWNEVSAKLGTAQYATDSAKFVTSSDSTITGTKQYALTTTGWAEVSTTIPNITATSGISADGFSIGLTNTAIGAITSVSSKVDIPDTTQTDLNNNYLIYSTLTGAGTTTGWMPLSANYYSKSEANGTFVATANIDTTTLSGDGKSVSTKLGVKTDVIATTDYVNSSFLPTSGGTVSGQLVVSGGSTFDQQFLKITREGVNGYARLGLGQYGALALKTDDSNSHTTQVNISPNASNDQLVQVQHNGGAVGYLIPAVTATTTAGLTNDGILHIILES